MRTPRFIRAFRLDLTASSATRRPRVRGATALVIAALSLGARPAAAQLVIDWHTIDGGGYVFSAGGDLALGGTIGQPDAGTLSGGAFVLSGGFWLGGSVVSGVPETPGGEIPPGLPGGPGDPSVPLAFRVAPSSPNPFSVSTAIDLDLPAAGPLRVRVFAPSGRLVSELCARTVLPGRHRLSWNGADGSGSRVASGVYLLLVQAGDREVRQRLVLIH